MNSRSFDRCFITSVYFILLLKAISTASGMLVIKDSEQNISSNAMNPNIKLNFTDNNIETPTKKSDTASSSLKKSTVVIIQSELSNNTYKKTNTHHKFNRHNTSKTSKMLLMTAFSTRNDSNFTTVVPTHHHQSKKSPDYYKVLLYILVPLSAVLLTIAGCFVVRHVQKIRRKRRLERELIHQYSYPNSEAGDDDQERLFEVESIINTEFLSSNENEEKNFNDERPQLSIGLGEGSKLVIEEESPLMDVLDTSTSFDC